MNIPTCKIHTFFNNEVHCTKLCINYYIAVFLRIYLSLSLSPTLNLYLPFSFSPSLSLSLSLYLVYRSLVLAGNGWEVLTHGAAFPWWPDKPLLSITNHGRTTNYMTHHVTVLKEDTY